MTPDAIDAQALLNADHLLVAAALIAAAIFAGILALAWPLLVPNRSNERFRESLRRKRSPSAQSQSAKLPQETSKTVVQAKPSKALQDVVNLFRFAGQQEDGKLTRLLATAGYRGRAATVKYLAARAISPIVLFALGFLYVAIVARFHLPIAAELAIVAGATTFGVFLPSLYIKAKISARQKEIGRAWPDAVDLLLICVETGMSIEHGFRKVAEEMAGNSLELAKELSLTTAELSYQQERRTAYENLARRIGLEAVKAVTTCLIQSEKYGTSLGLSLRVLAQESRDMRMAAAERKAAALPPKLTVPMIIFFLPILFAVIITPAAIQISSR